jgi:adenosylcobinamide-GDP ribazoletransferase
MNKKKLLLSLIISLTLGFLIFNTIGIVGITMGLISGVIIAIVSKKSFIWATGDVLGTSNEVARDVSISNHGNATFNLIYHIIIDVINIG